MRKGLLSLVFAVFVVPIALCGADPFAGTWKLNLEKSKEASDHPRLPKSETINVEEQDSGLKVANDQVNAQGKSIQFGYSAKFDGKKYPETGSPVVDTVEMKRINARTIEVTNLGKDGTVVTTIRSVISPDGKTRTSTLKAKDAKGATVSWVAVFDKQ